MKFKLFMTPTCPKCPEVKKFIEENNLDCEIINAREQEGLEKARSLGVMKVPTVIAFDNDKEIGRAFTKEEMIKWI